MFRSSKRCPTLARAAAMAVISAAVACDNPSASAPHASAFASSARAEGPRGEPTVFAPGAISTAPNEEYRVTFTPDGDTAYFARGAAFFPFSRQATIMRSTRTADGWSVAEVAEFSGRYSDIDPFITSDGSRMFFSSIRPVNGVARPDVELWMMERTASGSWGEPVHLAAVGGPTDDLYPSVSDDGTLYFGSDRPGGLGGWDIYRSRLVDGVYQAAENLGAPVNTAGWDFNPAISPDGRMLVFTGLNRAGGFGAGDLWASVLHQGEWVAPRNVGAPVNSRLDEYHASFSPDGKTLFFVRHDYAPWVPGSIYHVAVSSLGAALQRGGILGAALGGGGE